MMALDRLLRHAHEVSKSAALFNRSRRQWQTNLFKRDLAAITPDHVARANPVVVDNLKAELERDLASGEGSLNIVKMA